MNKWLGMLGSVLLAVCSISPIQAGVMITSETTVKSVWVVTSQSWDTLSLTDTAMRHDQVTWIPGNLAPIVADTGMQRSTTIAFYDAPTIWKLYPDSGKYSEIDVSPPLAEPQNPPSEEPPLIEFGQQDVVAIDWRHAVDESASGKVGDSCNSLLYVSVGRVNDSKDICVVSFEVCLSPEVPGVDLYRRYQQRQNEHNEANEVGSDDSQDFQSVMLQQYLQMAERITRGEGTPLRTTSLLIVSSSDTLSSLNLDSLYELMDPQRFTPISDLATAFRSLVTTGELFTIMEIRTTMTSIVEKAFDEDWFRVPADFQKQ